jgi:hypothetical protein
MYLNDVPTPASDRTREGEASTSLSVIEVGEPWKRLGLLKK